MEEYTDYQEFGRGESLILLPSNWLTSRSYQSLAKKLAKKYRVIVPNLFRGRSKYKKNALTIEDYSLKLHSFLQNLKIRNFYLVGVSFSGLIAFEYLNRFPQDLKKVMLVNTIAPPMDLKKNKLSLFTGFVGYLKLFYHNAFSWQGTKVNLLWFFDGFFNFFLKHPKQFFLDPLIVTKDYQYEIKKMPVPTKILFASKDEFIPYQAVREMRKVENIETETIDGYHAWFFLEEERLVKKIFHYFKT